MDDRKESRAVAGEVYMREEERMSGERSDKCRIKKRRGVVKRETKDGDRCGAAAEARAM